MIEKRIHSVGKYENAADSGKPFWVKLYWFEGNPKPLEQPVSEQDFFNMLNGVFDKQDVMLAISVKS